MTSRLVRYFNDYEEYHRTRGNKLCHAVGIPLILISTLGLLAMIRLSPDFGGNPIFRLDGGVVLWLVVSIWYLFLDWRISVPFAFFTLAGYCVGRAAPLPLLIVTFVIGWILQGVGHAFYERKSPAFFGNLAHLLIGPLWVFASAFRSGK